ncbi:pyridoxal phosphate-dependent decarboxylase family protein [Phenylobacterium sp.]|uniref:pyridoxal phosphate-dependent decarboxylase family protein n=1 Tax=Phenylobacterium sp. TaxID=1871053 RepID=UPI002D01F225|nr:pyridoxal-dependent decarboxylase [Phenylobacterium sp.]HVI33514.1 pyridoxal-dependent decarboxylase [Phenylobacterium sp.]
MTDPAAPKPYFLGPRSENQDWLRERLGAAMDDWLAWRRSLFADDPAAVTDADAAAPAFLARRAALDAALGELGAKLRGELPTYSPRYIGHMVSETALPALLGHFAALLHNPNNTSREASRVGTALEAEAIAMLAQMVGFDPAQAHGHFTSGGTVANLEAVWRARFRLDHRLALALTLAETEGRPLDPFADAQMSPAAAAALAARHGVDDLAMRSRSSVLGNPFQMAERLSEASGRPWRGPVILAPGHKHYSWIKAANVFGLGEEAFWSVPLDGEGRLSVQGLGARIEAAREQGRPVLAVVSVAGTTELGEIDPVDAVADHLDALRAEGVDIWHHVDAAYGGFFCALDPDEPLLGAAQRRALRAIGRAETVTIDPHKLGYAPYACGALLTRDAASDTVSAFVAPYVERAELGEAPWTRTLEGSRAATGAAATWLTGRALGFGPAGMGAVLSATLDSCRAIRSAVTAAIPEIRPLDPTDTNIFCFSVAAQGEALSVANARTAAVHARVAASPGFSMSRTVLGREACGELIDRHVAAWGGRRDADRLVLVRCVVMNPFWAEPAVRARLLPELTAELAAIVAATEDQAAA